MKKAKRNILISNLLICVLVICTFVQTAVLCIKKNFSFDEEKEITTVSAASDVNVIKKTGLLDLYKKDIDLTPRPEVEIATKEQFAEIFNAYFVKIQQETGYELIARTNMTVTPDAINATVYQVVEDYFKVDTQGNCYISSLSCEVPSPSGKLSGFGKGLGTETVIQDGVLTTKTTENVSFSGENGNIVLSGNYDKCQTTTKEVEGCLIMPFPFEINEKTIDTIAIKETTLSYVVTVRLNYEGYKGLVEEIMAAPEIVNEPSYEYFEIEVLMNKYGEVLNFSRREKFSVKAKKGIISSDATTICNGIYVINQTKNDE